MDQELLVVIMLVAIVILFLIDINVKSYQARKRLQNSCGLQRRAVLVDQAIAGGIEKAIAPRRAVSKKRIVRDYPEVEILRDGAWTDFTR
jgi:hypothetical protein